MLRATPTLHKMASTQGGMRRILKKRLPVPRYIELAVKAGSYKSPSTRPHYLGLHDVPQDTNKRLTPREREERLKLRRGVMDYPTEYEILSMNPPLPTPPRTPVRVRKKAIANKKRAIAKLKKERKKLGLADDEGDLPIELPSMDRLVKSYLSRHEDKLRGGMSPSQSRREEEYYSKLLLGSDANKEAEGNAAKSKFMNPSSLHTAMGRKAMLVENAYAFALKQQQVMLESAAGKTHDNNNNGGALTEQESIARVEQLLREEARDNRKKGRGTVEDLQEWRSNQKDAEGAEGGSTKKKAGDGDDKDEKTTIPSILHDRPRAIRALSIWSNRLRSIPYSRWTIGASTALDHWIAREVLQMEELTWQRVLEGGGTDAYLATSGSGEEASLPGGETTTSLRERMRDIVLVRGALFPETLLGDAARAGEPGSELKGELDDGLLSSTSEEEDTNATERSIDELLASLGELDDDDDDSVWKFDDDEEDKKSKEGEAEEKAEDDVDEDEQMASILDELQVWRERNASSSYESWDVDRKNEFDQWIEKYVATLYPEADATSVDKEATRNSLLSERPVDTQKTKEFWTKVRTESEAEVFLRDYRTSVKEELDALRNNTTTLTDEEKSTQMELEAILSVPFDAQLDKLLKMGTLRPILDEYAPSTERKSFFAKYSHIFLEGLEMEHLVLDPDGPIRMEDLGADLRDELSREWTPSEGVGGGGTKEPRFAVRKIAYGTDEFGTSRAERARELYRLWNEHKANRARFEEALFKRGYLGLEEDGVRGKKKDKKGKK
eukprot:CAMPEP_0183721028 /NCGR_PEP_ID=MMETSP0737-20130205/13467_1 /TAXON_ID=385413 /ORGANISM="Thalassiosira miniscula, Strain CCMP1093" /LENGTH=782 /DNA_ID=CAMNT_0025950991 /DNA_START=126 /DNA_END=2474 /DNA_ORIENTATION=+